MIDSAPATVTVERRAPVLIVRIERPEVRNCVDAPTASLLANAFRAFDADPDLSVAILAGSGGHFCAGADLKAIAGGDAGRANRVAAEGDGAMGPTRLRLGKPVIAAVSGYCVAGGLELATWCDLRIADETAIFGVFCRRFGVPLIDGGSVRLPRLIGMSRALDMILTGRPVPALEALQMGLVNRIAANGQVVEVAEQLARQLAEFPQTCMRGDRRSAYEQWGMDETAALANEFGQGLATLAAGEPLAGASRFAEGRGRHGEF